MATLETIRSEREAAETRAKERAARLDPDDYFASGPNVCVYNYLYERIDIVLECETHWDACLVILNTKRL